MKLIMENWRGYLNEAEEPTVNDFLKAMAQGDGKALQKILGVSAKVVAAIAAGALATAGATAGAAAVGATAAGVGVAAAAGLGEQGISKVMDKISEKAPMLAKWMYRRMVGGIDDDQREPIDHYFDIDDELEAVIKGGANSSPLFKKFADELYKVHKTALASMDAEEDANKPLKDFIAGTADMYLQRFIARGKLGDEFKGVLVRKAQDQNTNT